MESYPQYLVFLWIDKRGEVALNGLSLCGLAVLLQIKTHGLHLFLVALRTEH